MKLIAFGLLVVATIAQSSVIPLQTVNVPVASTTLVRTPSLDSAVINSERLDGAFRYETVENHAYAPVVYQSHVPWNVVQQYTPFVYGHYPQYPASAVYPVYNIIPQYHPVNPVNPVNVPNPQNPIDVEDPADNASNDLKEENNSNNDDDTVAIESA